MGNGAQPSPEPRAPSPESRAATSGFTLDASPGGCATGECLPDIRAANGAAEPIPEAPPAPAPALSRALDNPSAPIGERWKAALESVKKVNPRLADSLSDMAAALGPDRRAVVCRELTKLYEEVRRGSLAELAEWAEAGVRGEIVVVVAGAPARDADPETALKQVLALVADGMRLKDAAAEVAEATGLGRRDLYQAALERRR